MGERENTSGNLFHFLVSPSRKLVSTLQHFPIDQSNEATMYIATFRKLVISYFLFPNCLVAKLFFTSNCVFASIHRLTAPVPVDRVEMILLLGEE